MDEAGEPVDPSVPERLRVDQPNVPVPESGDWLPGPAWAWVLGAAAVFALAAVLTFSANGGDDNAAVAALADEQAAAGPDGAETEQDQAALESAPSGIAADAELQPQPELDAEAQSQGAESESLSEPLLEPELTGFIIPIDGACLSEFQAHFPSSPREYRNGIHEGFDFYGFASCRPIDNGTAVLAAKDGVVIRVDQIYTEITIAQFEEATDPSVATLNPSVREQYLDRLRGRQVWIDHGAGVVSRYAHLSAVAAGLQVGDVVRAGRVIAFVGESGQLEAITAPGTDWHLHFEIRMGESYLGEGLSPVEGRALYVESFGFEPGPDEE